MTFPAEQVEKMRIAARARPIRSSTGAKGITWAKDRGQYKAYINLPTGVVKHLGYFDKLEDAKAARKAGERKYFPKPKKADPMEVSLENCWNNIRRSELA